MLVVDSGNPGYDYESAARQFCVSPSRSQRNRGRLIYLDRDPRGGAGSGVVASGSLDDTHAILAQNPRIAPDDRVARRLSIYRPGASLAVIDEVDASG